MCVHGHTIAQNDNSHQRFLFFFLSGSVLFCMSRLKYGIVQMPLLCAILASGVRQCVLQPLLLLLADIIIVNTVVVVAAADVAGDVAFVVYWSAIYRYYLCFYTHMPDMLYYNSAVDRLNVFRGYCHKRKTQAHTIGVRCFIITVR